jgi:PAS domain S-box-containing protein
VKLTGPWLTQARTIHRVVQVNGRQLLLHTLLLGLAFSALLAIPFLLYQRVESTWRLELLHENQEQVTQLAKDAIWQEMDTILSDMRYLAQHNEARNHVAEDSAASRHALAREYLVLASQKRIYDQVRFIGLDGLEQVRVNFNGGRPAIVADVDLQDKSGRYYFEETLWLLPGQIFVSPLDLNVEGGSVEVPAKPVIRFSTPVADGQGNVRGMVVLNYLGQRLVDKLRALQGEAGRVWLSNPQGYWLLGPQPADEWLFMFPQQPQRQVAAFDAELWRRMVDEPSGVHEAPTAMIRFERVHPLRSAGAADDRGALARPVNADDYYWTIAVALPQPAGQGVGTERLTGLWAVYGALALFAFVLAGVLAFVVHRNRALAGVTENVLDALPLLVAYVDADQRYRFNNKAYERFFGLSPKQIYGKTMRALLGDAAYAEVSPYIAQALAGTPVSFERHLDNAAADMHDIMVTYLPDVAPGGGVRGFYVIVGDVSLVKQSERRERQHLIELSHVSRLASMGEMATEIAHEINQPLSAIAMFSAAGLRTLQGEGENNPMRTWLEAINTQAKRAGEIVQRVRRFVKKAPQQFGRVDLNQVARDVATLIGHDARAHLVTIALQLAENLPAVRGDRVLLEQVAFNLLRNALDAVEGRAGERRITLKTWHDSDNVHFGVDDNGPGVDQALGANIFDSFVTSKQEGLGMGLAISRSIIEAHAGALRYAANPGGGSTFAFSLARGDA